MVTRNCVEMNFWEQFPALKTIPQDSPYADLLEHLQRRAKEYFRAFNKCRIYGSEIDFEKFVSPEDVKAVCQDIWDHPDKYSDFQSASEAAYYEFIKFLWVEFPDGRDERLDDQVDM